jgi:hypothetical protein
VASPDREWLEASLYDLSEEDVEDVLQFADDCSRLLGGRLKAISLDGDRDAATLSVVFGDEPTRPGVVYSYEWRLRDLDDPTDLNPLGVLLVDYLGNNIMEDLQSTPGLPVWESDEAGVLHVDVRSERYRTWPQERRRLGRP